MRRLFLLALPGTLLAQPARPTVGPIDTGRTVFRIDTVLSNGTHVTLAHVGRSPKALVRVVLETGELARACGLDVSRAADSVGHMGGSLVVSVLRERVEISADVLRDFVGPTIELIASLVRTPHFDSTANAGRGAASADSAGMRALGSAISPRQDDTPGCQPVRPELTRVVVAGLMSDHAAMLGINTGFGDWRSESKHAPVTEPGVQQVPAPRSLILIHRPGAKQAAILAGASVPDPTHADYASLRVADAILGANVVSRITMNIREAKGYAYAPVSVLRTMPSGVSSWVEVADVSTGVTAPALSEILAEIKRLGAEEPAATEVEGAQRYLLGRYLVETATRSGWADANDLPTGAADPRRLVAVTAAEVRQSVAKWLAPTRLTVVVVADTVALGDQMAAIHAMTLLR